MGAYKVGILLLLGFTLLDLLTYGSASVLHGQSLNCSEKCECSEDSLENTLKEYEQEAYALSAQTKYKTNADKTSDEHPPTITSILGIFSSWLRQAARVNCRLSDGKSHRASSLLNNVDQLLYTTLNIQCTKGERIIWDITPTRTSLVSFISDGCSFLADDKRKGLEIPMNAWIWDIDTPDAYIFETTEITYTMNTAALSISGSRASTLPAKWIDVHMVSASLVNLHRNQLESYGCYLRFSKRLETLNLSHNRLTKFPTCLVDGKISSIHHLSLSHNRIDDISILFDDPRGSEYSPDIHVINLSYNDIEKVGSLRGMDALNVLDLSHNKIKEISNEAFINLVNIVQIYLEHNQIQVVRPYAFTMNTKLNFLELSNNEVTEMSQEQLPNGVVGSRLRVNLKNNALAYTPFKDCARGSLNNPMIQISMSNNPLICDCKMMEFNMCTRWLDKLGVNNVSSRTVFNDIDDLTCSSPQETAGKKVNDINFLRSCIIVDSCPNQCTCLLENTNTLLVNCTSRRLMEMPDSLPVVPNAVVKLHLNHNPLQMLSYRSYLDSLTELKMDNCLLTTVTPAAIAALQDIKVLTLHNNLLQKLPTSTRNITLNRATNVTLHNNRWECSCESLWLPRWLSKHKSALWMPGKIVCSYLRKPVEDLNDVDLNCGSTAYLDTFLAVTLVLTSLVSTLFIVFCYRTEINVLLYSKLGLRVGNNFSYGDLFHPYDAFVSYSQDNYKWVVDTLVPHLEQGEHKYRLCLHYRDFPAGESVVENIPWAIRLSRCSILVLSKDFLKREWCIMEVRSAFQRMLLVANRLIIIATDDISPEDLTPDLQAYMNTHDYLRAGEPCFWEKLEMFLPPKPAGSDQQQSTNGDDPASGDLRQKREMKECEPDQHSGDEPSDPSPGYSYN